MSEIVSWAFGVKIKPGQVEPFRALMEELVEAAKQESGTLAYEWFIDADEQEVHVYERYEDSAAVMTHVTNFGENYAERFMALVEPTHFYVYGAPSDEVKDALSAFGPSHFGHFGGFAR